MKKNLILSLLVMTSLMLMVVGSVSAIIYDSELILENKDASWDIISQDDIQATLQYNSIGQEFEYRLESSSFSEAYVLIYYADQPNRFVDWGGAPAFELGVLLEGETTWSGSVNTGDLPFDTDWNDGPEANYCATDGYTQCTGAKIWLIPLSDYDGIGKVLTAWNPTKYLFETDLITYIEDDDAPTVTKTWIEPEYPTQINQVNIKAIFFDINGISHADVKWKFQPLSGEGGYHSDEYVEMRELEGIYSSPTPIPGPVSEGYGEGIIEYTLRPYDVFGNFLDIGDGPYYFTYDGTPSKTTISVEEGNYITSQTLITLTAIDPDLVDDGGNYEPSGVNYIKYKINGGDFVEYIEPFPVLGEDELYTISYYSVDNAGNVEEIKTVEIILDNTKPDVDLNELDEFYNSVPINLEFTYSDLGSGVNEYKVYKKRLGVDPDFVDVTGSVVCDIIDDLTVCEFMDGSKDGKFEFYVEVIDNADNSQDSDVVFTTLDRAGPDAVVLENPLNDVYVNYQPLLSWFEAEDNDDNLNPPYGEYGVSGIKEYELDLDGEPIILNELEYQTFGLSEGIHTWKVRANDNAENVGEWSEERTFTFDLTLPQISNIDVSPKYEGSIYVAGTITVGATVTDENGVDSVTFNLGTESCDGVKAVDVWSCELDTTTLLDGEYSLIVTAVDVAENEELDDSLVVNVDNTESVTMIVSPEESSLFASDFVVSITDSDMGAGINTAACEYSVNGGSWLSRDCNSDTPPITVGEGEECNVEGGDACEVEVRSVDNLGNEGLVVSRTFSIDWTNPPQILDSSPSGTLVNDWAMLSVETNKPATCRYDIRYKSSYDAMSEEMETTGGTISSQLIEGLQDKSYAYYVLCEDNAENGMTQTVSILFDVDTRENFVVTIPETKGNYFLEGWNQFFLPSFVLEDTTLTSPYTVETVLESIVGQYNIIYHYDGTIWRSYEPGRPVNDLIDLTEFNGGGFPYFIDMTVAGGRLELV